jgi:hypothetical protein
MHASAAITITHATPVTRKLHLGLLGFIVL